MMDHFRENTEQLLAAIFAEKLRQLFDWNSKCVLFTNIFSKGSSANFTSNTTQI